MFKDMNWIATKDGDYNAFQIFKRHYSYYKYKDKRRENPQNPHRFLFCGPGEKMVLVTSVYDALFVWRKFVSRDGQEGINCAVFRNESQLLSSNLILEAEQLARNKWGKIRFYTYVNDKIVKSRNPGYCFKMAGWRSCGRTKINNLLILEKLPY